MGKRRKKTFSLVADQEIYYFGIKGINFVSTLSADCLRVVRVCFIMMQKAAKLFGE